METYTYVNIDTTKVKEYLELNGYSMNSMSKMLGYSDSYLFNSMQSGKMAADAYKTMCNMLGTDETILTVDDEHDMYHTGTKVANTNTTVKFRVNPFKAYLKEIRMSMEALSTKMGYTYNYVGACVKTGKMNEDAYAKMCDVLRIGKSKFAKYEYEKKPATDKPKVAKPKVEKAKAVKPTKVSEESKPLNTVIARSQSSNYSQLVMTDAEGHTQIKVLVDKDEFDDLNSQLSNLLNIMDSAFSQISQLQLKLNELTSK